MRFISAVKTVLIGSTRGGPPGAPMRLLPQRRGPTNIVSCRYPARRFFHPSLVFLLVAVTLYPFNSSFAAEWSERKLNKTLVTLDRAMDLKRWHKVIDIGQEALPQCITLKSETAPACVTLLNKINHALYHNGHFQDNRNQIEKAYFLSVKVFSKNHPTTVLSRELYYRLLLADERYLPAIDIVKGIIEQKKAQGNDEFEVWNRTRQLYALYGLTKQYAEEEGTLRVLLEMTDRLLGSDSDEYREIAQALAENLCIQKKYFEFFQFDKQHNLKTSCKVEP